MHATESMACTLKGASYDRLVAAAHPSTDTPRQAVIVSQCQQLLEGQGLTVATAEQVPCAELVLRKVALHRVQDRARSAAGGHRAEMLAAVDQVPSQPALLAPPT